MRHIVGILAGLGMALIALLLGLSCGLGTAYVQGTRAEYLLPMPADTVDTPFGGAEGYGP